MIMKNFVPNTFVLKPFVTLFFYLHVPRLMVWWDIGGGVEMVGVRYFSGNRKVRQSGKSREVATLHPTTPPGKTQGWSSSSRRNLMTNTSKTPKNQHFALMHYLVKFRGSP